MLAGHLDALNGRQPVADHILHGAAHPRVAVVAQLGGKDGSELKLKLQYSGDLMRRGDSLEKTLMLER